MAQKTGTSKSATIREIFTENPKTPVKEVVAMLKAKGTPVTEGLVYIVRGSMKAKLHKEKKVAKRAAPSSNGDPLATIKKIKSVAAEVGGLTKLKALVEALS